MGTDSEKIAVVGMACRFPGAKNLDEYWNNLLNGKETIKQFSDEELRGFEINYDELKKDPNYVPARGVLNDVEMFDAPFFGYTPNDAAMTDPQHRVWLETTWDALENAACDPYSYKGAIGVFAGGYVNTYLLNNILRDPRKLENYIRLRTTESFQIMTGNDIAYLPTKTAYKFNLRGPAINVQTACSTSLVAISQACQSLYSYESDTCIAGGVCIITPQEAGYIFQEGAIPSPDGHCRPFDAKGQGTVFSNGVGVVVLKRLEDALKDNDTIYSVVNGWALNNDGNKKVSYTAPSVDGQAEAILMAQSFGDVSAEQVGYIEAHGTATQLGDPIEISALTKAFARSTTKKQFCGIGSVKSNIGHTDAAAGVASFIKACLSAYNRVIPPTLNYDTPNPHIDFANTPFYVVEKLKKWESNEKLIIGVSSFGIGGTNSHVVLEEPPAVGSTPSSTNYEKYIIPLSAKSPSALEERKKQLIDFVKQNPDTSLDNLAYTLWNGRNHMLHRGVAVINKLEDLLDKDLFFDKKEVDEKITSLTFMFPGQGAQFFQMGKELYQNNDEFRAILDDGFDILLKETGINLPEILFNSDEPESANKKLAETSITQSALFIIEYGLARILQEKGVRPNYMIGHSIGEYAAACIAGVFDFQSALKIVIKRGQLMQSMPAGKMYAVRSSLNKLREINNSLFEIAAENAPNSCTISFETENAEEIKHLLEANEIQYLPLNTSHAFHSKAFDPILREFAEYVSQFRLSVPQIPVISCYTGDFLTNNQAISGDYWAKQLRNTVLFNKGISTILTHEQTLFIEVGPNAHLSSILRSIPEIENKKSILQTIGRPDSNSEKKLFERTIGSIWASIDQYMVNLSFINNHAKKIKLPSYPFERQKHWIEYESDENIETAYASTGAAKDLSTPQVNETLTIEEQITGVWKELIGANEIKPDDDFFMLGGHSLLALQILTRIKEQFGVTVTLKDFLSSPTVQSLSETIKQNGTKEIQKSDETEIVHLEQSTNLPLTKTQRRIWITCNLNKTSPAYNIPMTFRLNGDLNLEIFQKSLFGLFKRHHIMHAVFRNTDGEPYCEINEDKSVVISQHDLSGLSEEQKTTQLNKIIGEDSRTVFDLESGPLYRLHLIKTRTDEYYFHATVQHIIFDGLSWGIFINDFNSIYGSLENNKPVSLEEIKYHQYDYAHWFNESNLAEKKLAASEDYWRKNLEGVPPYTSFPYDRPRKNIPSGFGAKEHIAVPAEISAKLVKISKSENATVFFTMLSAFSLLIHKYSGDNDFCLGSPVSNRPKKYLENIFGMFVNTIALRFKYENINNFSELLRYTRNLTLDAITHQDLAFEKVVDIVNPDRSLNYNPIFQIAFAWQDNLSIPINTEKLSGNRVTIHDGISPFDLTFYMWENGDTIEGEIEYNIDILEESSIKRLKENFLNLLENITEGYEKPINLISIVSDKELNLLSEFTNTKTEYPKDKSVIDLFNEQVTLYPDSLAVRYRNESLTYSELDQKSSQLARTLLSKGIKRQEPVGLLVDKSIEMVVGILAILKAECFYLPIDNDYPKERIDYILTDANCTVVVSQEEFKALIPSEATTIDLNDSKNYQQDNSTTEVNTQPDDLAYIMYTSGTTGRPKGSMIMNKSIVRLIRNTNYIELNHTDSILLTGAIVFDATTFEIWGALLNGGQLHIIDKELILDANALGDELMNNNITTLWLTSPLFTHLAEISTDIFSPLKNLLVGGDVISPAHINRVRKDNPGLQVINGYGPTENTTFSACFKIDSNYSENIPIGKPISNSTAYIFDEKMNYVPIGVIGELYVGGDGVSKGYLNREELNQKKFVYHPVYKDQKLFKTGDHAKWLPDGNIEFHGRIDNQIKIRGFRVELEEIEAALMDMDNVIEAVVKPHSLSQTDLRLVAFLNVAENSSIHTKDINTHLKNRLPLYMIPAGYKFMNGFPKTINGKIDKKQLIFDSSDFTEDEADIKSEELTDTEKKLLHIWTDALKVKNVSIHDNFFDIGGNSLLSIGIVSKIEEIFDINFNLRYFFDSPIIKDLAQMIDIEISSKSFKVKSHSNDNIIKGEI